MTTIMTNYSIADADVTKMNMKTEVSHCQDKQDSVLYKRFDDMNLPESLLRGVFSYGFEEPSEIQQRAIVPVSSGQDIMVQAQSGTGKTGTFLIGLLAQLDERDTNTQFIVLSPTRELAYQTGVIANILGSYMHFEARILVGGQSIGDDLAALRRKEGIQMLCCTPGRLLHMLKRKQIDVDHMKSIVFDEADVLLEDFRDDAREIMGLIPSDTQAILVSATMTEHVKSISTKLLRDPLTILLKAGQVKLDGIRNYYVGVDHQRQKLPILLDLYEFLQTSCTIVFVNKRRTAQYLADVLEENEFTVGLIHSEMSQPERFATLKKFRNGGSRVLIATDVCARGIDVHQVSIVINYDLPREKENYIHRIGRGGRFGKRSAAINLVAPDEYRRMDHIARYWQLQIQELPGDFNDLM